MENNINNPIDRKVNNITIKKSMEPIQIGNTPLFLIPNEENEYYKLTVGRFIITDGILNEDMAIQWAKDNILEVMPQVVVTMLELNKQILETINN